MQAPQVQSQEPPPLWTQELTEKWEQECTAITTLERNGLQPPTALRLKQQNKKPRCKQSPQDRVAHLRHHIFTSCTAAEIAALGADNIEAWCRRVGPMTREQRRSLAAGILEPQLAKKVPQNQMEYWVCEFGRVKARVFWRLMGLNAAPQHLFQRIENNRFIPHGNVGNLNAKKLLTQLPKVRSIPKDGDGLEIEEAWVGQWPEIGVCMTSTNLDLPSSSSAKLSDSSAAATLVRDEERECYVARERRRRDQYLNNFLSDFGHMHSHETVGHVQGKAVTFHNFRVGLTRHKAYNMYRNMCTAEGVLSVQWSTFFQHFREYFQHAHMQASEQGYCCVCSALDTEREEEVKQLGRVLQDLRDPELTLERRQQLETDKDVHERKNNDLRCRISRHLQDAALLREEYTAAMARAREDSTFAHFVLDFAQGAPLLPYRPHNPSDFVWSSPLTLKELCLVDSKKFQSDGTREDGSPKLHNHHAYNYLVLHEFQEHANTNAYIGAFFDYSIRHYLHTRNAREDRGGMTEREWEASMPPPPAEDDGVSGPHTYTCLQDEIAISLDNTGSTVSAVIETFEQGIMQKEMR